MDNKNLIKNILLGTISFGLGSLMMYKLVELSLADYMHKKDKGSSTNMINKMKEKYNIK